MKRLEARWLQEVHQSRLVVRADETSYLTEINLPVSTVAKGFLEGVLDEELMGSHPGLTEADIRACGLFIYLRATAKI